MSKKDTELVSILWEYYDKFGRDLPWRKSEADGSYDVYKILVSEIMLQQTQVSRVITKYGEFLERFPTLQSLATSQLSEVLQLWSGLGYNRRAKYLHDAAKQLVSYQQPYSLVQLTSCKGIGYNTAAATMTYAYNMPYPYIETNIRTVFINHYFANKSDISDSEILTILNRTIDSNNPREFMWAIMDYGSFLKANGKSGLSKSKHYTKQSIFEGSIRQIRGEILRAAKKNLNISQIKYYEDSRFNSALQALEREGLIKTQGDYVRLAE